MRLLRLKLIKKQCDSLAGKRGCVVSVAQTMFVIGLRSDRITEPLVFVLIHHHHVVLSKDDAL